LSDEFEDSHMQVSIIHCSPIVKKSFIVMSSISINTRELVSPCFAFCSQGLLFGTWRVKEFEQSQDKKWSQICCVMGHVDAGKTKLLDFIKRTNVQKTEAGGITQQISATYIPTENLRERTKDLKADAKIEVAGLLVIDTPRHESFNNIRSRGFSLCDVAILVVDITNGLQPQTIESIKLLKMKNTDLIENHKQSVVVALNKVHMLYGWKTCHDVPIANALKLQSTDVHLEFKDKVTKEFGIFTFSS
nr:eukaryotic translation initiation factor 5B-like [Tanacetum cinerariifolium]